MTKFQPGDDVLVDFDGVQARGEVIRQTGGWVMATIEVDPLSDFGSITARLAPHSTVCVPETRVEHAAQTCVE